MNDETGATAPQRVTILDGDDSIGRERMKLKIAGQIAAECGSVVHERFDSTVATMAEFLDRAMSPSLFQETRIFHVPHAQDLPEGNLKELARAIAFELPDVYFIVEIDEAKSGREGESKTAKKLMGKKAGGHIACLQFVKPPDYRIAQWLVSQVPVLFGRRIGKDDAERLVDLVGYDIGSLYSELQKIDIHLDPGAPLDRATIDLIAGAARQMTVFELAGALGERDFPRALQVIDSLFATSFYAPTAISALFRHFWALFRIRLYERDNPDDMKRFLGARGFNNPVQNDLGFAIGRAAGLLGPNDRRRVYPAVIASNIVGQARTFSFDELRLILRWLLDFDVGVKTGRTDPSKQSMQLLCYKIVRSGELIKDGIRA